MSEDKKRFKRFTKRAKPQTVEERIKSFILRNSKNGYYTRISTLSYKFEITNEQAWDIVGGLLADGIVEATHDERSGEMKLCETGKIYDILNQEQKRKREKTKEQRKMNRIKKKEN